MTHSFKLGQVCSGEGLKFEVIRLDPLIVRCVENNGWWSIESMFKRSNLEPITFVVGGDYYLSLGNETIRNFIFRHAYFPWCSLYEDPNKSIDSH